MKTDLNNLRRYGVELEFVSNFDRYEMARLIEEATGQRITVAGYSDKSNKWRLKSDSSVSGRGMYGMELVTPILKGEADMDLLKRIVAVCDQHGKVSIIYIPHCSTPCICSCKISLQEGLCISYL